MNKAEKVIVIGGGITGLTTAYLLAEDGYDVNLLERDRVAGGTMKTVKKDGWLIECGPNSALETTPLFADLFSRLNITAEVEYANELSNKRYILRNGALHPIPMSPVAFLKSKLWKTSGKIRLLKEPFVGRGKKEETIAEFVTRRLGHEFLDYAINPFVAGVFAGNPEKLSVSAAFPKLYALEEKYGGLIRGMILGARERKKRAEKAKDRARQFSFIHGMQTFPDTLMKSLGNRVHCNSDVKEIAIVQAGNGASGRYRVTTETDGILSTYYSEILVIAVPAYVASGLLRNMDPDIASELESIYYPPVAEVFLGFKKDQVGRETDGFGFLIPEKEKREILGTIWSSTIFTSRAPEGYHAFTTFIGGSRQPELAKLPDDQLLKTVMKELNDIMRVKGEPVLQFINRWEKAIPQYQLGHHSIISRIVNFEERYPGIILGGNYRGGISVGDCIKSAYTHYDNVKTLTANK